MSAEPRCCRARFPAACLPRPSIERRALHTFVQWPKPGGGACGLRYGHPAALPVTMGRAHRHRTLLHVRSPSLASLTPATRSSDTRAHAPPAVIKTFQFEGSAHGAGCGTRCAALRRARLAIYGLARGRGATPCGGDAARASWPGGRSAARRGCGVPAAGTCCCEARRA